MPGPFLKWAGGKGQLLDQILPRLPNPIGGLYVEPFLGGGAVFFELVRRERIARARLCDANAELIAAYKAVRDDVDGVIAALAAHRNDEAHYYEVRAQNPSALSPAEAAARTIFLNRVGYNGLYRVNSKGEFNVPFGRYKNPRIVDEANLRSASAALAIADLQVCDFDAACEGLGPGDVVYFDPPYVPVSKTANFTAYASDKFGEEEQARLAATFARLVDAGVYVLLSNSDTPRARELYAAFDAISVEASRAINSKADRRGAVRELLVRGVRATKRRR